MKDTMTAPRIKALKGQRKLSMLTAYDCPTARVLDRCGLDMILVGDSLGMVVLGREDTLSVTMEEMLHHVRAVARGVQRALLVADMPFLSYESSAELAVLNAGRMLKEGGARAVKLEGGAAYVEQVRALVRAGIPVQGHIGLTPQRIAELGGFKVQGRGSEAARVLVEDARALAEAGVFSIVLEAIPAELAGEITASVTVPTIGIGAGAACDGQVLVTNDLLGLYESFVPKFVKRYANLAQQMEEAITAYKREVEEGVFPAPEHSFE